MSAAPTSSAPPTPNELVIQEFSRLSRERIYRFAKEHKLKGLSKLTREDMAAAILKEASKPQSKAESTSKIFIKPKICFSDIVTLVSDEAPLGRQHVILWDVPSNLNAQWSTLDKAQQAVSAAGYDVSSLQVNQLVGAPSKLTISRVEYGSGELVIEAAGRRHSRVRAKEFEQVLASSDAVPDEIEVRAYQQVFVRAWVRFRWEFGLRRATLQIGQLSRADDYTDVQENLKVEVPWLPVGLFDEVDLAAAVDQLHEQAENEQASKIAPTPSLSEIRLQSVDYMTNGMKQAVSSLASDQPMLNDDPDVVDAVGVFRKKGRASRGNFYWRTADDGGPPASSVLAKEFHAVIAAHSGHVHLMRRGSQDEIDYVLGRIRALA